MYSLPNILSSLFTELVSPAMTKIYLLYESVSMSIMPGFIMFNLEATIENYGFCYTTGIVVKNIATRAQ